MNAHEWKAQADSNDNEISKGIFRNMADFSGGSSQSLFFFVKPLNTDLWKIQVKVV